MSIKKGGLGFGGAKNTNEQDFLSTMLDTPRPVKQTGEDKVVVDNSARRGAFFKLDPALIRRMKLYLTKEDVPEKNQTHIVVNAVEAFLSDRGY